MSTKTVAIFGATGAIGKALCEKFLAKGYDLVAISRRKMPPYESLARTHWLTWDVAEGIGAFSSLKESQPLDAVVWAQGANFSDNILCFDVKKHEALYSANVTYILVGLHILLQQELIAPAARLCIISSVWQNIARQDKLSYCITKSALQGLVQSLCVDLGPSGYLINAVLPGALDTPMTRANLTTEQICRLEGMTPLRRLSELDDVCNLVAFLCSTENTGITGQFIAADRGFSYARIV